MVVESRSEDEPADAKCNTIAARTMEIFRQFGVADQVRACGLTDGYPTDVVYATKAGGMEITRIVQPSRNERIVQMESALRVSGQPLGDSGASGASQPVVLESDPIRSRQNL